MILISYKFYWEESVRFKSITTIPVTVYFGNEPLRCPPTKLILAVGNNSSFFETKTISRANERNIVLKIKDYL